MAQGTNQDENKPQGSDLTQGVALTDFVDGKLLGHVGDDEVLLVRRGDEFFAVGAHCAHYHGPLPKVSWSATPCAVPGITPASICAPARLLRAPALSPIAAGMSSGATAGILVKDKRERAEAARPRRRPTRRTRS